MQTLRRERRNKFEQILSAFSDKLSRAEIEATADLLADAAESRAEHRTDETKGDYKPDMVDLELSKLHAMSIRKAVEQYFRLNVKWNVKYALEWLEWAHEQEITAEQIKTAADTWRMDKQFNWQVPTLKGIFEKWQILMDAEVKLEQPERPKTNIGV